MVSIAVGAMSPADSFGSATGYDYANSRDVRSLVGAMWAVISLAASLVRAKTVHQRTGRQSIAWHLRHVDHLAAEGTQ